LKKTFTFHKEFQQETGEKFIVSLDKQSLGIWLIPSNTANKLIMTVSPKGEIDIMTDGRLETIEITHRQPGRQERIKLQAHL